MRLRNTNVISNQEARRLISFCKPSGLTKFDVMLKRCKWSGGRGRAYYSGSSYHFSSSPFIVVSANPKTKFPYKTIEGKGYIGTTLYSFYELLVFLFAHELRHLWQSEHPKGWRVYGAKGQYSERDADAYAIHKVREFRRK